MTLVALNAGKPSYPASTGNWTLFLQAVKVGTATFPEGDVMRSTNWFILICLAVILASVSVRPASSGCVAGAGGANNNIAVPCDNGGSRPPPPPPDDDPPPVYIAPRPGNQILQDAANRINAMISLAPRSLVAGRSVNGVNDFSTLAQIADDTLHGAYRKRNYHQARLWAAQSDLKNWSGTASQWYTVRQHFLSTLATHEAVVSTAEKDMRGSRLTADEYTQILKQTQKELYRVTKIARAAEARFYRTASKLEDDLPPPGDYRRAPRPVAAIYAPSRRASKNTRPLPSYLESAQLADPQAVVQAIPAVVAFDGASANRNSVQIQLNNVGNIVNQAASLARQATATRNAVGNKINQAQSIDRDIRRARNRIEEIRGWMGEVGKMGTSAVSRRLALEDKIERLDLMVPVKALEAAAWGQLESRMVALVEKHTSWLGSFSGLKDVHGVMKDAAALADGVLAVAADAPAAFVYDLERIPDLERRLDKLVDDFSLKLYATATPLPGWMVPIIQRYLERRPWR
jgi:hypothetical protein